MLFRSLREEAEDGNAESQCLLGRIYSGLIDLKAENIEIEPNPIDGIFWLNKSAEKGNQDAIYCLAMCYLHGLGVEKNAEKAAQLFFTVAVKGYASAQNELGKLYEEGEGVNKNGNEAFKWYSKSAEHGFAKAQVNLANCYLYGIGVEPDVHEALRIMRLAADAGNADAQDRKSVV